MKFLKLVLSLGYCFVLNQAFAGTELSLVKRDIPQPIYRSLSELWLKVGSEKYRSLELEFIGKNGLVSNEKLTKKFKQQDYNCDGQCTLFVMNLPINIENVTCEVKALFQSFSGEVSSKVFTWGQCKQIPPKPSDRLLGDLIIDETNITPELISIQNTGASINDKTLNVALFLEDQNKNIIWAFSKEIRVSLKNNETIDLATQQLKNWQSKLGCKLTVILDSNFQVLERNKLNNITEIEYGDCETVPSSQNGDLFDFEPVVSANTNNLSLDIKNIDRLPMQYDFEVLEYFILFKDQAGNNIYQIENSVRAPFYGFGDIKSAYTGSIPANACFAEVYLNRNYLLKESNYQNNNIKVSLCNSGAAK